MRLTLDIDPHTTPVHGWLEGERLPRVPFTGLLELLSVLDTVLAVPDAPRPVAD